MIDIDRKIEKIEKNCLETAKKELNILKKENDDFSEDKILEKVNLYKDELSKKYKNELNKIEREFNRNTFDYEMNQKMKITTFKNELIEKIENNVKSQFENFTNTAEYKYYLLRSIENVLSKIKKGKCIIFITQRDYEKYYKDISMAFSADVDKMDNENIGGCIVVNRENKISIDNTLKTNISQKITKINL